VPAQVLGREPESGQAQAPTGSAQGKMGKEVLRLVLRAEQEPSPWQEEEPRAIRKWPFEFACVNSLEAILGSMLSALSNLRN